MSSEKNVGGAKKTDDSRHTVEEDVEAAIIAGGEIVGTAGDDEPLVEGPNSK